MEAGLVEENFQNMQNVVAATRRLRSVITGSRKRQRTAVSFFEQAVKQYESGGIQFRAFMFSEIEALPLENKTARDRMAGEMLTNVLMDVEVANVLMAAGHTIDDPVGKSKPELLDNALLNLQNTQQAIGASLELFPAEDAVPGTFGFDEMSAGPEIIVSKDLQSALTTFRNRSDETLFKLVSDAEGVIHKVITAISENCRKVMPAALGKLGDQVCELPKLGRLFRWGLEKLEGAITALGQFLGTEALNRIKTKLVHVWQDVQEGKQINRVLSWLFDVDATRNLVTEIVSFEGLKINALDQSSNDFVRLAVKFEENTRLAQFLVSGINLAGILTLPLVNPQVTFFMASAHGLILASVLLIGMDYAGSGHILKHVNGVQEILQDFTGGRNG